MTRVENQFATLFGLDSGRTYHPTVTGFLPPFVVFSLSFTIHTPAIWKPKYSSLSDFHPPLPEARAELEWSQGYEKPGDKRFWIFMKRTSLPGKQLSIHSTDTAGSHLRKSVHPHDVINSSYIKSPVRNKTRSLHCGYISIWSLWMDC